MFTSIIVWTVLGSIVGFFAGRLRGANGERLIFPIVVGIVGAILGGWLFMAPGSAGVIDFRSIAVPIVSALVVLAVWQLFQRTGPVFQHPGASRWPSLSRTPTSRRS